MYCNECKINYKGEFKYCITCNEELLSGKICSHCHTVNSENSKICNLCGEFIEEDIRKTVAAGHEKLDKVYKECVKCHARFNGNKIYCEECGSDLVLKTGISADIHFEKQGALTRLMHFLKIC